MLLEQEAVAEQTKAFLVCWGLKVKFVAGICGISPNILSKFLNHKVALSNKQLHRLTAYMEDYILRNDIGKKNG